MNIDKLLFEIIGQEIKKLWPEIQEIKSKYNDIFNKLSEIKNILEEYGMDIDDNGEIIVNKKYYFYKIADDVMELVSLKTGIPTNEIKNTRRYINNKQPRQIIYFFLLPIAKEYGKSQQTVSNYVANQDHATAIHGRKVIFDLLSTNAEAELELIVYEIINELKKKPYLTEIIEQIEHEIEENRIIYAK